MELKFKSITGMYDESALLIEPNGIEIAFWSNTELLLFLLIEPNGIEIAAQTSLIALT